MTRCVFLIGAGFSAPLGVPTMRPFFDDFQSFARKRYPQLEPTLDELVSGLRAGADIEGLLSAMNAAADVESGLPRNAATDEVRAWSRSASTLRGHLLSYIVERCEQFDRSKAVEALVPLITRLEGAAASVFTTNYDRAFEYVAASSGVVLADGFERGVEVVSPWTGDFDEGLTFAKLHGSVTWYVDAQAGPTYLRLDRGYALPDPDFHLSRGGSELQPLMIVPTLEKQALTSPYNHIAIRFSEELHDARLVVVLGSSLRDEHIRGALRYGKDRLVVLVVGNSANTAANELTEIQAVPLKAGTEEFLRLCVEPLFAVVEDVGASERSHEELTERIRAFAEHEAGRIADSAALPPEQQAALEQLGSAEPDRILSSLAVLRGNANPAVLQAVRALLGFQDSPDVRAGAAGHLAVIGDEASVTLLLELAVSDPSPLVRLEASLSLSRIGGPAADEALRRREERRPEDDFGSLLPS